MMKKALGVIAVAGLAIVLVISLAQAEKKEVPSGQMGMMGSGMMGRGGMMGSGMTGHSGKTGHGGMHGMMGGGMMGMPCPMMAMGGRDADPKLHGEMMVLKGQMMKKMAEMMAKQGDRMIQQGRNQAKEAGK